ncbi:MAG: hypothetical protein O3C22_09015 [Bacteroidetes bacterium]|nr:hypothetical protein [Bacteroidota bacterium]
MRNFSILILFVLNLLSCGNKNNQPVTQVSFSTQISQFQSEYAEWDGNDLKQDKICEKMNRFIDSFGQFKDWTGIVGQVNNTLGDSWVTVDYDNDQNIDLKLWPEGDILGNKALDIFYELKPKNQIIFSGKIIREMSITNSGMMRNPEIKIEPTKITIIK